MATELSKEEKLRLKEERRKAFEAAHPELAAKRQEASAKKEALNKKKEDSDLNDQEAVRREKMEKLRTMGIDPFGHAFKRNTNAQKLKEQYGDMNAEALAQIDTDYSIAGRIMAKRRMGKLGFIQLQDRTGRIQVVINQRVVGDDTYELFKMADLGDILGIQGRIIKTQTGELSLECHTYTHLSKAIRPLPEKFHGLTDKEERYRLRYSHDHPSIFEWNG